MATEKHLILEGSRVCDIKTFYDEINRVFMAGEKWQLGESLDALDDMFRGGYGASQGFDRIILNWRDMDHCRRALGVETTRRWLLSKLAMPEIYSSARIKAQLDALDRGDGPTYFEIILDMIAGHERIRLTPG